MKKWLIRAGVLSFVGVGLASAQTSVAPCTTIINTGGQPACVPVTAAAPLPVTGGGGGGGAVTVADGADVTQGANADAAATAGGTGTVSAKLRNATALLGTINTALTTGPVPISGSLTANQSVNEAQINGVTPLMGNGASGTGAQRVTIASDSTGQIGVVPLTAGGLSTVSNIVANNTTSVAVKASAGQLYGLDGFSISAATPVYVKFYDAAQGSTTCGSGTPKLRYMIPASGGAPGSGIVMHDLMGATFATAITYCVTAALADADTTAPAASTYVVNFMYK